MKPNYLFFLLILLVACNSKPTDNGQNKALEENVDYYFTCNLKDDEAVISKYKHYHSADGVWPEVTKAAEVSGADKIQIYIQDTRLVMVISLPKSLSFDEFNKRYAGASPKLKEWGEIMGAFQIAPPGAEEGQTWVKMENIYDFHK
jgi:L-rhamnose mutarotase